MQARARRHHDRWLAVCCPECAAEVAKALGTSARAGTGELFGDAPARTHLPHIGPGPGFRDVTTSPQDRHRGRALYSHRSR